MQCCVWLQHRFSFSANVLTLNTSPSDSPPFSAPVSPTTGLQPQCDKLDLDAMVESAMGELIVQGAPLVSRRLADGSEEALEDTASRLNLDGGELEDLSDYGDLRSVVDTSEPRYVPFGLEWCVIPTPTPCCLFSLRSLSCERVV